MSEKNKAPLILRIKRLRRLATWLWHTGKNLRRIDGNNPAQRQRAILTLGNGAINAIGIKLNVNSMPDELNKKGALIAANHISWLDIFALSALYPSSFIAKQEIKNWPILGKMGVNAGTVFINRNSRKDITPINAKITEALQQGRNVSFFPEAKTSLGLTTQPFKAALFQAAIEANAPILPVSLRYYNYKGERTTIPSYAGKMNLFKSLWRIVSMPKIYIDVDFGTPIYPADHPGADRYALKDMAEQFINNKVLEDSPENINKNKII